MAASGAAWAINSGSTTGTALGLDSGTWCSSNSFYEHKLGALQMEVGQWLGPGERSLQWREDGTSLRMRSGLRALVGPMGHQLRSLPLRRLRCGLGGHQRAQELERG